MTTLFVDRMIDSREAKTCYTNTKPKVTGFTPWVNKNVSFDGESFVEVPFQFTIVEVPSLSSSASTDGPCICAEVALTKIQRIVLVPDGHCVSIARLVAFKTEWCFVVAQPFSKQNTSED